LDTIRHFCLWAHHFSIAENLEKNSSPVLSAEVTDLLQSFLQFSFRHSARHLAPTLWSADARSRDHVVHVEEDAAGRRRFNERLNSWRSFWRHTGPASAPVANETARIVHFVSVAGGTHNSTIFRHTMTGSRDLILQTAL
jgi:hypothetical protein